MAYVKYSDFKTESYPESYWVDCSVLINAYDNTLIVNIGSYSTKIPGSALANGYGNYGNYRFRIPSSAMIDSKPFYNEVEIKEKKKEKNLCLCSEHLWK